MIIDERTYPCHLGTCHPGTRHPGKVKAFLEVYEQLGKRVQWPVVGEPVGFFTTSLSPLK